MQVKPRLEYSSPEHGYWLGTDDDSGRHYAAVAVTIGDDDFDGFYELSAEQHARFLSDQPAALVFVEGCRRHEHDDVLRFGWSRDRRSSTTPLTSRSGTDHEHP